MKRFFNNRLVKYIKRTLVLIILVHLLENLHGFIYLASPYRNLPRNVARLTVAANLHAGYLVDFFKFTGADINHVGYLGATPLMLSIVMSDDSTYCARTVEILLQRGADPNLETYEGRIAMNRAARKFWGDQRDYVMPMLVKYGGNPNIVDTFYRMPPLGYVNHLETFKTLIEHGADPYIKCAPGKNSLLVKTISLRKPEFGVSKFKDCLFS